MKKMVLLVAMLCSILLSGSAPSLLQSPALKRDLADLARRGITYRSVAADLVELREEWSGRTWLKSLQEQDEVQVRSWAAARGIPILEIDPNLVDTNQYSGWYTYWGQLPLSNGLGIPLVIGDADRNGETEVYGVTRLDLYFETNVCEIDSNGQPIFLYNYNPSPGVSRDHVDVDTDSLNEIVFSFGGLVSDFEQPITTSLPTILNFEHERYQGNLSPGFTGIYFGSLDGDTLRDFLYKGSECDSVDTTACITKVYIAEYNYQDNNFLRVWSTDFDLNGNVTGVGGFAVGDFDGDARAEFAVAEQGTRRVFVVENAGNNDYEWTWQDSLPLPNLYFTVSGDVDNDGKPEFFVGATTNGSWTTMYEADSNDHYSAKFVIHLLSGGLFDQPTYLTTDVDGDGVLELAILSGNDLYILKSKEDNTYYLWYLKRENTKDAVQVYDFNNDNRQDFIISKLVLDSLGRGRFKADIYLASDLVSVPNNTSLPAEDRIGQNYPNPFNSQTRIRYSLPSSQRVRIQLYDILGRHVSLLVDERQPAGHHEAIWNASGFPSGIYFDRFTTARSTITRKMLLLR